MSQLLAEYISQPDKRLNGRLLLHYGFILPGNPHDSVSIKVNTEFSSERKFYRVVLIMFSFPR